MKVQGVLARRRHDGCPYVHLKEDFGTSSWAADNRIYLLPLCKQRKDGSAARLQIGNTSEDDADEASYGQHENRCDDG